MAVAALGAAAGALAIVATSDHADQSAVYLALTPLAGLSFAAAGLVAWSRRPENRTGPLLIAVGFAWFLGSLIAANASAVFTLGTALASLFIAAFVHLVLAFPSGRLAAAGERALVAASYAVALLAPTSQLLTEDRPADCDGCPESAITLTNSSATATGLRIAFHAIAVALALAVVAILVRRWRAAGVAGRRVLGPVYLAGLVTLVLVAVLFAMQDVSQTVAAAAGVLALASFCSVPFVFLAGLLRTRLARAGAGRLLQEVPDTPTLAEAQAGLRRALGDPTARLAFWADGLGYVDTEGNPFELPPDSETSVTTKIEYQGDPLAALVHDPSLREQPELLGDVVAAARVALEKDRSLRALRASEQRTRALLDAMPDHMFRIRRDGTYVDFHSHSPNDLHAPPDEIVGRAVRDVLPEATADRIMGAIERALSNGGVETVEYELILRGARRFREARIVKSDDDEVLAIVRDITERKRTEDELRASRARLVEAGDAERRRLERNLHDGAQQRLVSVSLSLRLAQAKLASDVGGASEILSSASVELALALEELRELARGIHPAVLTERGLDAALESLADRAPLPVEIEATPAERLPPPVEAAAFYVVSESLANIAKYARAKSARVSVTRFDGRAVIEISDDGVGGADPARGSGLRGLVDRVEALDGRLRIDSRPGAGTSVRAEIPCGS